MGLSISISELECLFYTVNRAGLSAFKIQDLLPPFLQAFLQENGVQRLSEGDIPATIYWLVLAEIMGVPNCSFGVPNCSFSRIVRAPT